MAKITANSSFDMSSIDFNRHFRELNSINFLDDINYFSPTGIVYEDLYKINSGNGLSGSSLIFGGYSMVVNSGVVLSGTVTGFGEQDIFDNLLWMADGVNVSAVSIYQTATTLSVGDEQSLITDQLGGDDEFFLSDFDDLAAGLLGDDIFYGGAGDDILLGFEGDDTFHGGTGDDSIDGGDDRDTVIYDAMRSEFSVNLNNDGSVEVNSLHIIDHDKLIEVERLEFTDGVLVYEDSQNADFTYRMYTAAYFRTPDEGGFLYWTGVMDRPELGGDGTLSYADKLVLANEFLKAAEFVQVYGSNPTNEHYVELMYNNVLKRVFDQPGRDYWLGRMDEGAGRDEILTVFVDSLENLTNTEADRSDGFWVL